MAPSALAELAGISSTTLTRPLNNPDHKFKLSNTTLEKIRAATGIDFFDGADGSEGEKSPGVVATTEMMIPVYDVAASAGHGAIVDGESVVCNLAFDRTFLRRMTSASPKDLAIIGVQGHSMEPALLDGDHVLVDQTKRNLAYDGLFVLRFDGVLHVKRIGRSAISGNVMVVSDHPSYRDLDMPKADLDVVGRVLWIGRKV